MSKEDLLEHLLYRATKSEKIKKKRKRNWIIVTFGIFLFALGFYLAEANILTVYYCILTGIVSLIFFPAYDRYQYSKHYRQYVDENLRIDPDEIFTVKIADNIIEAFDNSNRTTTNLTAIEEIAETGRYFYLTLKTGEITIIPKAKIQDADQLSIELKALSIKKNIAFISDLAWKWR